MFPFMAASWIRTNVTGGVIATLLAGSLAGSVFTWYMSRPTPTTLGYVATTTSTGADSAVRSLVPNLSLRIGDEVISSMHTHVVELFVRGAYLESAPLGVVFD